MRQELLRQELLARTAVVRTSYGSRIDGLGAAALDWHPPGGGWSAAELFEHLLLSGEQYEQRMRPALAAGRSTGGDAEWRPTIAGRLIVAGLTGRRRLPAPRVFRPGPAPRVDVAPALLQHFGTLAGLLELSAPNDWRRTTIRSPVTRLLRFNMGDAFLTLVTHAERHLAQLDRIRAAPGFPA